MENPEVENLNYLKHLVEECIEELSQRFKEKSNIEILEEYDLHYLLFDKFLEKKIHKFWKLRWEYNPSHNRKKKPGMLDLAVLDSQHRKNDKILIGIEIKFLPEMYETPPSDGMLELVTKDLDKLENMKENKWLRHGYLLVFARKGLLQERSTHGRSERKRTQYLDGARKLKSHVIGLSSKAEVSVKLILDKGILSDEKSRR